MSVRFYVDPATNSADPDVRMAYGLHVVAPWGGTVLINFPEHLEYMPGTKGIARHHATMYGRSRRTGASHTLMWKARPCQASGFGPRPAPTVGAPS